MLTETITIDIHITHAQLLLLLFVIIALWAYLKQQMPDIFLITYQEKTVIQNGDNIVTHDCVLIDLHQFLPDDNRNTQPTMLSWREIEKVKGCVETNLTHRDHINSQQATEANER